jgi:hypothetical protein
MGGEELACACAPAPSWGLLSESFRRRRRRRKVARGVAGTLLIKIQKAQWKLECGLCHSSHPPPPPQVLWGWLALTTGILSYRSGPVGCKEKNYTSKKQLHTLRCWWDRRVVVMTRVRLVLAAPQQVRDLGQRWPSPSAITSATGRSGRGSFAYRPNTKNSNSNQFD